MEGSTPISGPFIFDSSALIDIENAGQVNALPPPGRDYLVPWLVHKEINKKGKPLERWLRQYSVRPQRFLPQEHSIYFGLITQRDIKIHDAEATAIAMAINRKGTLVITEGPGRAKAENHGVVCINGNEFLSILKPRLPGL